MTEERQAIPTYAAIDVLLEDCGAIEIRRTVCSPHTYQATAKTYTLDIIGRGETWREAVEQAAARWSRGQG